MKLGCGYLNIIEPVIFLWAPIIFKGSPGGSVVKNPLADTGLQVLSLGQEDPLEKEMATHSSTLASEMLWTEEPVRPQYIGSQKSQT